MYTTEYELLVRCALGALGSMGRNMEKSMERILGKSLGKSLERILGKQGGKGLERNKYPITIQVLHNHNLFIILRVLSTSKTIIVMHLPPSTSHY